jgi:hypothetical protein
VTTGIVTGVALTKGSPFNLFSLTKAMQQGCILGGDNTNGITLTKGTNVLKFDIPIVTPKGVVYAMYMRRTEVAASSVSTNMKIEKAHRLLGHQSEDTTRQTAKYLGWNITSGALQPCLPCTIGKAKQKNMPCTIGKAKQKNTVKMSNHDQSKNPGERIFTDIASIRPTEGIQVAKPHWCIKVDERTQFKVSSFHAHKTIWLKTAASYLKSGNKEVTL